MIGFFASIDKAYLHTFFDFASAKQHAAREFRNATSDFEKLQIFGYHKVVLRGSFDPEGSQGLHERELRGLRG